ncbi:MAG: 3TM-type holin [bacterium]
MGKNLLDRVIPDQEEKRKAEMELIKMAADGELKQVMGQLEINAKEAAHPSVFVAGWRPAFGWVGAAAFGYSTILQPLLTWIGTNAWHWTSAAPLIQSDLLWVVITGMLGIGGMRTFEKQKGVSK